MLKSVAFHNWMFILAAYVGSGIGAPSLILTCSLGLNAPAAKTPIMPCLICLPLGESTPNSLLHFNTSKKSSTSSLWTTLHLQDRTYVTGGVKTPGVIVQIRSTSAAPLLPLTDLMRWIVIRLGSMAAVLCC